MRARGDRRQSDPEGAAHHFSDITDDAIGYRVCGWDRPSRDCRAAHRAAWHRRAGRLWSPAPDGLDLLCPDWTCPGSLYLDPVLRRGVPVLASRGSGAARLRRAAPAVARAARHSASRDRRACRDPAAYDPALRGPVRSAWVARSRLGVRAVGLAAWRSAFPDRLACRDPAARDPVRSARAACSRLGVPAVVLVEWRSACRDRRACRVPVANDPALLVHSRRGVPAVVLAEWRSASHDRRACRVLAFRDPVAAGA
jgi:hypothetical protein